MGLANPLGWSNLDWTLVRGDNSTPTCEPSGGDTCVVDDGGIMPMTWDEYYAISYGVTTAGGINPGCASSGSQSPPPWQCRLNGVLLTIWQDEYDGGTTYNYSSTISSLNTWEGKEGCPSTITGFYCFEYTVLAVYAQNNNGSLPTTQAIEDAKQVHAYGLQYLWTLEDDDWVDATLSAVDLQTT